MECPKCGLINYKTAKRCDCGYDFATGTQKESYLPVATRRKAQKRQTNRILFFISLTLWLGGLLGFGFGQYYDSSILSTLGIICLIGGFLFRISWWATKAQD